MSRYHESQFENLKVITRFLPRRVGQMLAIYLAYVHPLLDNPRAAYHSI